MTERHNSAPAPDAITMQQFATLAGVTPDAVRKWVRSRSIPTDKMHRISLSNPKVQAYMKSKQQARRTAAKPPAGTRNDIVVRKSRQRQESQAAAGDDDGLSERERAAIARNERKLNAEVRKLEAQATAHEIKNQVARGALGDIKFLQSLFYQQLAYAIRQFITLPQGTVDDMIALVLEKGKDARTEVVNLQNEMINQIGVNTKEGWETNMRRIESDLLKLAGESDE